MSEPLAQVAEHTNKPLCKIGDTGLYHSLHGQVIADCEVLNVYFTGQVKLVCIVNDAVYHADNIPIRVKMDPADSRRWFVPGVTKEDWLALLTPESLAPPIVDANKDGIPDVDVPEPDPEPPKAESKSASKTKS